MPLHCSLSVLDRIQNWAYELIRINASPAIKTQTRVPCAVVTLAQSLGLSAPANERMVALVRAAEAGTQPALSGVALWQALTE